MHIFPLKIGSNNPALLSVQSRFLLYKATGKYLLLLTPLTDAQSSSILLAAMPTWLGS